MRSNHRYPYDVDAALGKITRHDKRMSVHVSRIGQFQLAMRPSYTSFQALLRAIVYQQVSGAAATTVFGRIRELAANGRLPGARDIDRIADDQLQLCGLSGQKLSFIRALVDMSLTRKLPSMNRLQGMSDEGVKETLIPIRGVGDWTVQMLLIFHLGRPDILPVGDVAIRKGQAIVYTDPASGVLSVLTPAELIEFGERWRPYRTVASWYLWRAVDPNPKRAL